MRIDLTHKRALITGASGELGRVMALTLAECGADVAVHYHKNEAKALELKAKIEAMGGRAFAVQADIQDFAQVTLMRQAVLAAFGGLDILIVNAVSQYQWKPLLEQELEVYPDQFRSCVMQSVHLAKAFAPGMIAQRYGRIVGINTECAMQCFPAQSAYASAKRGMDGIFRVLAKEIGPHGITVNQVAPGWTVSDRDRASHTERREEDEASVPLRRRGTDQEIANVVAFLASDLASFITGAYVPVCGGNVAPGI